MWEWLERIAAVAIDVLVLVIVVVLLWVMVAYFVDRRQTKSALRRVYPVLARGRYAMEFLGEYLRGYLFAGDRDELPFTRNQRNWVYRAAKNVQQTVPFGSKSKPGVDGAIFTPALYPTMTDDSVQPALKIIGDECRTPYKVRNIYHVSGMSYGSLSKPAVQALCRGALAAGSWVNTGEGGLSDYHLESGANLVVQIGTAKFGVRTPEGDMDWKRLAEIAEIEQVRMFELKLSQGAKPGKGGILPAAKVTPEIARLRRIKEDEDAISPNRHKEICDHRTLGKFLERIRSTTGKPVGIKLCMGEPEEFDEMCAYFAEFSGHAPDFITIDGGEGGTGAAPPSLMDYVGLPLFEAIGHARWSLDHHKLDQIELIASGKLLTPDRVAQALALGADFCVSARGFMMALGCIVANKCNANTCPTGITTHDPHLQRGLDVEDKSQRVTNFIHNMEYAVGTIAHSCGVPSPDKLEPRHVYRKVV